MSSTLAFSLSSLVAPSVTPSPSPLQHPPFSDGLARSPQTSSDLVTDPIRTLPTLLENNQSTWDKHHRLILGISITVFVLLILVVGASGWVVYERRKRRKIDTDKENSSQDYHSQAAFPAPGAGSIITPDERRTSSLIKAEVITEANPVTVPNLGFHSPSSPCQSSDTYSSSDEDDVPSPEINQFFNPTPSDIDNDQTSYLIMEMDHNPKTVSSRPYLPPALIKSRSQQSHQTQTPIHSPKVREKVIEINQVPHWLSSVESRNVSFEGNFSSHVTRADCSPSIASGDAMEGGVRMPGSYFPRT